MQDAKSLVQGLHLVRVRAIREPLLAISLDYINPLAHFHRKYISDIP